LEAIGPVLVTWVKEKSLRESNIALSTYSICNPGYQARRGVSTPNALRPTGLGVIS